MMMVGLAELEMVKGRGAFKTPCGEVMISLIEVEKEANFEDLDFPS
jgi:hypothetical protein